MEKSVGAGGEVRRREVARLHAGDLLGESCLVHEVYRLEGVAGEFTELLCIGKTNLNTLLEQHPAIGIQLLKLFLGSLSSKITRANETAAEKK